MIADYLNVMRKKQGGIMDKLLIIKAVLFGLIVSSPISAAPKFSALCMLKSEHHYHLANSLDKKSKMINEWSTNNERSTSLTVDYSGGKHLDIIDSRRTDPLKAPIIFDNGNTLMAVFFIKGADNGVHGATTRTYAVNLETKAIISTTIKSGKLLTAALEGSVDGNPECVFKFR